MKTYFGLAFLLLAAAPAHGLYFDVVESETRCFIEEVPDETLVVGMVLLVLPSDKRQESTKLRPKIQTDHMPHPAPAPASMSRFLAHFHVNC